MDLQGIKDGPGSRQLCRDQLSSDQGSLLSSALPHQQATQDRERQMSRVLHARKRASVALGISSFSGAELNRSTT